MNITPTTKFWVVTKPTKDSTLADILFESDLLYLSVQFRGGLAPSDIICIYEEEELATNIALGLLTK